MPHSKKQHFVPKFYLRNFSFDEKRIKVYNLNRKECFDGNIDNICYGNYFYDKDGLVEKSFSGIEGSVANMLKNIIESKRIGIKNSEEYFRLLLFIGLQQGRTKIQGEIVTEMANKLFDQYKPFLAKEKKIDSKILENMKLTHPHPANYSSLVSSLGGVFIWDLNLVLLKNNTSKEFVTSDNPVIEFNPFFNEKVDGGVRGFAQRGLTLYYPINPSLALFFYDRIYYSLKKEKDAIVEITNVKDIRRLNGLQIIFCEGEIYFKKNETLSDVKLQHNQLKYKRREKGKTVKFETVGKRYHKEGTSELIRLNSKKISYRLDKLSFLNINKDAPSEAGIRDPELLKEFKKFFGEEVEDKIKKK